MTNLYQDLRLTKVRGLGGKLGESVVTSLGVQTMSELAQLSLNTIGAKRLYLESFGTFRWCLSALPSASRRVMDLLNVG